jgi:hypothetical protein
MIPPPPLPPPMFDCETYFRRPTWRFGAWIDLGDRQSWALPRVDVAMLVADARLRGAVADLMAAPRLPAVPAVDAPDFPELTGEFIAAAHEWQARCRAVVSALLLANYAIEPRHAGWLAGEPTGTLPDGWTRAIDSCLAFMGHEALFLAKARGVPISPN